MNVFEFEALLSANLARNPVNPWAEVGQVERLRQARAWRAVGAQPSEAADWITIHGLNPQQAAPLIEAGVDPLTSHSE